MMMTDMNDGEQLRAVLRDMTLNNAKPSRQLLAASGVDGEILQRVHDSWRQHRHHLRGYQSYSSIFKHVYHDLDDNDTLNESTVKEAYRHAILLEHGCIVREMEWPNGHRAKSSYLRLSDDLKTVREREGLGSRGGRFTIAITRDCEWILYVNYPHRKFYVDESVKDFMRRLSAVLPDETFFAYTSDHVIPSLALTLAGKLVGSLEHSIRLKESNLEKEKPSLEYMRELMSRVRPI